MLAKPGSRRIGTRAGRMVLVSEAGTGCLSIVSPYRLSRTIHALAMALVMGAWRPLKHSMKRKAPLKRRMTPWRTQMEATMVHISHGYWASLWEYTKKS